jgi:hypothetical protein
MSWIEIDVKFAVQKDVLLLSDKSVGKSSFDKFAFVHIL